MWELQGQEQSLSSWSQRDKEQKEVSGEEHDSPQRARLREGKGCPAAQAHLCLTLAPSPHSGTSCALAGSYANWLSPCTWWGCFSEP